MSYELPTRWGEEPQFLYR